ncbi:neurotactin isoform X2 [Belonocnema kinseyi]|uniref:neurotactin isoform X2 n=1 Tax=Belonocnema kinseyi TaxID=2817044 RepID=UPI00143DD9DF|nr:neurotactin isoform X2 [Belonocnema kinseyi]
MSQTIQDQLQENNMDKKEIGDEEREKMMNAQNTKHISKPPTPDLETEEHKPKRKIPIGGIKMPGFCRTKSKEPCEENDVNDSGNTEVGTESLSTKEGEQNPPASEKSTTSVKELKEKEGRRGILNSIRLPLVSVFPRKKKDADVEHGTIVLASVETLEDATERNLIVNDDGMETVRLGGDANDGGDLPKPHPFIIFLSAARRNLFVSVASLLILLAVIVIISVACAGPRYVLLEPPLKDGKYIAAPTSCGMVEGILEDGGYAFRGIPYAVPPINNRRWQPAEPLRRIENCWSDIYLAHNNSANCWQRDSSGRIQGVEDCLKLDVFTPKVDTRNPLPVVVMIGAETLSGGSPGVMQPSSKLARVREIVFVRPNFRMGVFGFLAVEPLSRTTHPPTSGNYGLSDIIVALKWIQNNIHHFGGDKSNVTIWGHRAGGTLVTTLIGARKANDLFARAWISSGSAIFPGDELSKSEQMNDLFLNLTRCSDSACLRSKSAEELMDAVPVSWQGENVELPEPKEAVTSKKRHEWLVLDGSILQEHVGESWKKQDLKVKVVMGSTAQSGTPAKYLVKNATLESTQVDKIVTESLLGTMGLKEETQRLLPA